MSTNGNNGNRDYTNWGRCTRKATNLIYVTRLPWHLYWRSLVQTKSQISLAVSAVTLTFSLSPGLVLWPSPYSFAYCCHISASLLWRAVTLPRSSFNWDSKVCTCSPRMSVRFSTTARTRIWRIYKKLKIYKKSNDDECQSCVTFYGVLYSCYWLKYCTRCEFSDY